jgi:hypothetical protein
MTDMTLTEKDMAGLILEALIEAANEEGGYLEQTGTPDLETLAKFTAEYILKRGFWMEM